jgi:hypothetical protein
MKREKVKIAKRKKQSERKKAKISVKKYFEAK